MSDKMKAAALTAGRLDMATAMRLAEKAGFARMAALDTSKLVFHPAVREMCAADRCHQYGKNWVCPPGCGSLAECAARASGYGSGLLVQTAAKMRDDFDAPAMLAAEAQHQQRFAAFVAAARLVEANCLPLGAGACKLCADCTYPNAPCRHPDSAISSMEAFGLLVADICHDCGLPYSDGRLSLVFSSCLLFGGAMQ